MRLEAVLLRFQSLKSDCKERCIPLRGIEDGKGRIISRPISLRLPVTGENKRDPSGGSASDNIDNIYEGTRVQHLSTTGFFVVPTGDGNIIELNVMISSHASVSREADIVIDEKVGDDVNRIFFRRISVPAGGGRRMIIEDVESKTIKVGIRSPRADGLFPSVAVTETFRADGAVVVLLFRSPAFFVEV